MNMILHGRGGAEIEQGNTLATPQFTDGAGHLTRCDFAVAIPPFSTKAWSNGLDPANDEFHRFEYGEPPAKNGDFAFLLHLIASLKSTGMGTIILPHGVLFRGNREADIRRIVDVFNGQKETPGYARMVPLTEIASETNDDNLDIPRYIDSSEPEDLHDLGAHLHGGIPNRDIDPLGAYWAVFPALRKRLFGPGAPIEEQRATATVLSDMDTEIAAPERRLNETRAIKQGMMQQLLTGSIRLPIPDDATEGDAHGA